jgi:hypothetical protein
VSILAVSIFIRRNSKKRANSEQHKEPIGSPCSVFYTSKSGYSQVSITKDVLTAIKTLSLIQSRQRSENRSGGAE